MSRGLGVRFLLAACYRSHGVGDEGVACPDAPCAEGNGCEVRGTERTHHPAPSHGRRCDPRSPSARGMPNRPLARRRRLRRGLAVRPGRSLLRELVRDACDSPVHWPSGTVSGVYTSRCKAKYALPREGRVARFGCGRVGDRARPISEEIRGERAVREAVLGHETGRGASAFSDLVHDLLDTGNASDSLASRLGPLGSRLLYRFTRRPRSCP